MASVGPDTIRAELAETRVAALRSERLALLGRLGGQDDELIRLRKLVEALQARLVATEQELAQLRADRAQLGLGGWSARSRRPFTAARTCSSAGRSRRPAPTSRLGST